MGWFHPMKSMNGCEEIESTCQKNSDCKVWASHDGPIKVNHVGPRFSTNHALLGPTWPISITCPLPLHFKTCLPLTWSWLIFLFLIIIFSLSGISLRLIITIMQFTHMYNSFYFYFKNHIIFFLFKHYLFFYQRWVKKSWEYLLS